VELKSKRFIAEEIEAIFDQPPALEKKPGCPDGFIWRGRTYHIVEMLAEWRDYQRRGRMARNMMPAHAATAELRGSWGVGQFFFRVHTDSQQIFDIYYDRAPKDANRRKGTWFLYRELSLPETEGGASEGGASEGGASIRGER
jgi:hypothetical protein